MSTVQATWGKLSLMASPVSCRWRIRGIASSSLPLATHRQWLISSDEAAGNISLKRFRSDSPWPFCRGASWTVFELWASSPDWDPEFLREFFLGRPHGGCTGWLEPFICESDNFARDISAAVTQDVPECNIQISHSKQCYMRRNTLQLTIYRFLGS